MSWEHVPVMLEESLAELQPQPGSTVIDGTLGLAGHASALASRIAPSGMLIGFDRDLDVLEEARRRLALLRDVHIETHHADYRQIPTVMGERRADGVLLDLGVSNVQITDAQRGFSFREDGPLDMRMDRSQGETAAQWLARAGAKEIEDAIFHFGDERWARRIAQKIVERRAGRPIETTDDLVQAVLAAIPTGARDKRIHPATRTFQAVRIAINAELDELEAVLRSIAETLSFGGRMVVLSYHSGEDRAAKRAFRALAKEGGFVEPFKRPQTPSEEEVRRNPKSRSAKMRAIRREVAA